MIWFTLLDFSIKYGIINSFILQKKKHYNSRHLTIVFWNYIRTQFEAVVIYVNKLIYYLKFCSL